MARTGVARLRLVAALLMVVAAAAACTGSPTAQAGPRPAASGTVSTSTPITSRTTTARSPAPGGTFADTPCAFKFTPGDLPTWARAGFRGPAFDAWPFVTSSRGDIVGVLFGYPLVAPPPGENEGQNKILWVPKDPSAGELTVTGHLVGTYDNVDIGNISFGPSIVDVPRPGCWRFTLQWTGGAETVDIVYRSTR